MHRIIWLYLLGFFLLLWPPTVSALEVGARFRVADGFQAKALASERKENRFLTVGIPTTYSLYLKWFAHSNLSFGPYASLGYTWSNTDYPNPWYRVFGGTFTYYPNGHNKDGYFLDGEFGGYIPSGTKEAIASIGLGWQTLVEKPFVYKVKVQYSRWIENASNQISLSLVLGRRRY